MQLIHVEICYNILYVERHGRNLRDPWSLRQFGVYHQLCKALDTSRWILLNPTERIQSHLRHFFESRSDRRHLALHIELLLFTGSNWTEYIEYLSAELKKHVSKSTYPTKLRTDECRMRRRVTL